MRSPDTAAASAVVPTIWAAGTSTQSALPSAASHVSVMALGVIAALFAFQLPTALLVSSPTSQLPYMV